MDIEAKHQADTEKVERPAGTQDQSSVAASAREPEPEFEPQLPETD